MYATVDLNRRRGRVVKGHTRSRLNIYIYIYEYTHAHTQETVYPPAQHIYSFFANPPANLFYTTIVSFLPTIVQLGNCGIPEAEKSKISLHEYTYTHTIHLNVRTYVRVCVYVYVHIHTRAHTHEDTSQRWRWGIQS
jgi:hypothetical protein